MIQLVPGIVIAIKCIWGEHWGIVSHEHGRWTLISNRGLRNRVTEERLEEVIDRANWRVVNFATSLPRDLIVERARSMIGSRYDLWKWNCQDFVYWALGFPPRSPQREAIVALLGMVSLVRNSAHAFSTAARCREAAEPSVGRQRLHALNPAASAAAVVSKNTVLVRNGRRDAHPGRQ